MYIHYDLVNKFFAGRFATLKNYEKTMKTVYEQSVVFNAKNTAVEYLDEQNIVRRYSYKKFHRNVVRFAGIINQILLGVEKDQIIVLKMANNPHWGEVFWSILMAGYKPLLIDARTNKQGTQNLIDQSKAAAIFSEDIHQYSVMKLCLDDLLEEKHKYAFTPCWADEVIFCSSGTTGNIKLMVYNGANFIAQIESASTIPGRNGDLMYPKKVGTIKILAMLPLHHIFAFIAIFLWYTYFGKTIVYPSSISPNDIQKICQKVGITHVFSVPLFWNSLAQSIERKVGFESKEKQELIDKFIKYNTGEISKEDAGFAAKKIVRQIIQKGILGSKIKYCISGGGFLKYETLRLINGIGYNLYNGYGMTEIGVSSVELSDDVKIRLKGEIGRPLGKVEYKITDNGELLVRSPFVHAREIIGGIEQDATLDEDGFFHTGDIAKESETGYCISGRSKDIIINADGENIFPDELESYFVNIPHVNNYVILGVSEKNKKEEKIALVLEIDNSTSENDLQVIKDKVHDINPKLPHGVRVEAIYLAKKKLPLAGNMKVKRYLVKESIEKGEENYLSIDQQRKAKDFKDIDQNLVKAIIGPVRKIFSDVLILPVFKIDDTAHWINDLGGDSMNYVELIRRLEEEFAVHFKPETLGTMSCVNDFVYDIAILQAKK